MSNIDQLILEKIKNAKKQNKDTSEEGFFKIKTTAIDQLTNDRDGGDVTPRLEKDLHKTFKEGKAESLPAWFVRANTQVGGVHFEPKGNGFTLVKSFDWPFKEAPGVLDKRLPKVFDKYCNFNITLQCLDELLRYIPEHEIYVESNYVGFLLRKPRSPIEIVNDRRKEAIMFWRYIQFYPEEIAAAIEEMPISQWYKYEFIGKYRHFTPFLRAVGFWYQHKYPEIRGTLEELRLLHERIRWVDFRCEDQHRTIASTRGDGTFTFAFGNCVPEVLSKSRFLWIHKDNDYGRFLLERMDCFSFIKEMTFYDRKHNFIVGMNYEL